VLTTMLVAAAVALPAAANPPDPTRPDVELSVNASVDRPFTWEIEKTAAVDKLTLGKGETATVGYTVTVTPTEGTTSWSAVGEILVYNKELEPVTVTSVANEISGVGPSTVTCQGAPLPRQLGSGAQLRCRFTAEVPDSSNRISTATASVGSNLFTVSAPVDFGTPIDNRIDHCVEVHDSMVGLLAEQICVNKANKTVEYSRELGPFDCGKHTVSNTAWAIANHTGARVEDTLDVKVSVPCEPPPDECEDKDGKHGKYGWYGGHDRDECEDDDDRCERDGKYGKYGWWDKDRCDRDDDDDRCERDGKYGKYGSWDKDRCDRDDDDRCDRSRKHGLLALFLWLGWYDHDDRCDRDGRDKDRDRDKRDWSGW
jgi:hypothetical protein